MRLFGQTLGVGAHQTYQRLHSIHNGRGFVKMFSQQFRMQKHRIHIRRFLGNRQPVVESHRLDEPLVQKMELCRLDIGGEEPDGWNGQRRPRISARV